MTIQNNTSGHVPAIAVKRSGLARHRGILTIADTAYPCALGPAGLAVRKREGDSATPVGRWPVRAVLYRPDRLPAPPSPLPVVPLAPDDGWCDDPSDRRYNTHVKLPIAASAEALWRDDEIYDIVVVLGHNDDPPVSGFGSCIFFHLARPGFSATEGCIAVTLAAMRSILSRITPETEFRVVA